MPVLDATALESYPEGLAFLRSVLRPEPGERRRHSPFSATGEPGSPVDTRVEILVEAAAEQSILAA